MHESGALQWRELVERHHSSMIAAMADEISGRLETEVRNGISAALTAERTHHGQQVARACEEARRSQAELLNQALRGFRNAASQEQVLQFLAESCAPFARKVVVLVFENDRARALATKGIAAIGGDDLSFAIESAPAVVSAVETRDPVIALASADELSRSLADALAGEEADEVDRERAYLFPLIVRQSVRGLLAGCGEAFPAPLELLCGCAAMRIETLSASDGPALPAAQGKAERASWDGLSAEEQKIHLQAQRMARVRVAEMRLYHEASLRQGAGARDIYKMLKTPLDEARQEFLHSYLSKSPTMVDYLHLEIVRSLAGDDDRLLGPDYPGPMV